jgi:hypothetical protein
MPRLAFLAAPENQKPLADIGSGYPDIALIRRQRIRSNILAGESIAVHERTNIRLSAAAAIKLEAALANHNSSQRH